MHKLQQKIRLVTDFIIDSLFPLSPVEQEVFDMNVERAKKVLPPAPPTPLPDTFSIFHYKDERVQKIIWNIKYKKSRRGLSLASYFMVQSLRKFSTEHQDDTFLLVPIPITQKRRKERGYNQCELIIESMQKIFTEKDCQKFIYEKNLLSRKVHKDRQTLKNRANRLESAKGIFAVDEILAKKIKTDFARKLEGQSIHKSNRVGIDSIYVIVIDDVITTGSTIKEAMDTLKNSGFKKVTGISIAH